MMSGAKKMVPKRRFKEFLNTGDWEQRKLGDLMEVTSVKRIHQADWTNSGVRFFRARDIVSSMNNEEVDNPVFISEDKYEEYSRISGKVIEGDLLVTGVGTIGVPYLIKDATPLYFKDGNIIWFKNNNILNGKYFYYCFQNNHIQSQIYSASGKGTVGTYTIENGKKTSISYPSLKEQIKIGKLLDTMTMMITLHQRKLDKLQATKKALLQEMFPEEGQDKPKRRFKDFTDAWEQRKLDDIAKIKTGGGTPKTANPEYWSGNIPWIQSSDLVEGDIVHVNINKFINNNALKNSAAKLISRDSIALVTRVGVGKVAVINQDFTTSQDFLSLSDFDGSDIKFLAYQLYRLMQENAKVLQGTSIKGITKTELIEQSISIPSSGQEQNLISNVLSKIDSIITLHQRKLDKLKNLKQAYLNEMFV